MKKQIAFIALALLISAPAVFAAQTLGTACSVTGLTVTENGFVSAQLANCDQGTQGEFRLGQSSSVGQQQMKDSLERALVNGLKVNFSARKASGNQQQIESLTVLKTAN